MGIEIDLSCDECGSELETGTLKGTVVPCQTCHDKAIAEGMKEGHETEGLTKENREDYIKKIATVLHEDQTARHSLAEGALRSRTNLSTHIGCNAMAEKIVDLLLK